MAAVMSIGETVTIDADHIITALSRESPPKSMNDLVDRWQAQDGAWLEMRRMRPSDEALLKDSLNKLSADSRRNRFFAAIAELSDQAVH